MLELKLVSGQQVRLVLEDVKDHPTMIEGAHLAHFFAMQAMLRPEEMAMVCEIAAGFSPVELRGWLAELSKLTVPQAVENVRVLVAGNSEAIARGLD